MKQPYRAPSGGRIRRDRPIRFSFDGRVFEGYEGDTLASALLANGVDLIGRSFKYHRPRGIMTAGAEEPNALVTIERDPSRVTPNLRATTAELYEGLSARTQNAWPSVRFDLGTLAGFMSPVLAAGFYYKTFMWPARFWNLLYEPVIRAAAGLGLAPRTADPDRYLHRYAHCDVLVIGAGPAGLAAAKAAAALGHRTILCDEQAEPGGSLLSQPHTTIDGVPAWDWIGTAQDERVTVLSRTTAFGWYPGDMIALAQRVTDHLPDPNPDLPRERLWLVRAKRVVIAAGAIERPLVFPGNDRPGIMLAGAAETYLYRYGVLPKGRVAMAVGHDRAWFTAFAMARAGVTVAAILDRREQVDRSLLAMADAAGVAVYLGTRITGTSGRHRVRFIETAGGPAVIPCDTVLMSDGRTPSVHLFSQSRGRLRFDSASGTFLPGESAAGEQSAGACAGVFGLAACLAAGHRAGGGAPRTFRVDHEARFGRPAPPVAAAPHGKAFVDFQNDVTTKDLAIATGEGFRAIEHVKRYTTSGMATDQGKTANLNTLATVAALTNRPIPDIGLTTFRPPYTPVTFGGFAGAARGALFDPVRRTPIDDRDAAFEDVGSWKRAHYYPLPGESMHDAVARECRAVRDDVGLFDASTLGKIEVVGPDAAEFLNRIYTGDYARLRPGRCRYGLLLGEDGFVRDDGVIARLAPDRFHVTTTTGGAAGVLHHMEDYRQTEFPSLRVWLTSTTEQWAVIAVQGPRAAAVLAPFLNGIDLPAMPHMSVREGRFANVPIRLFRVSFSGELGFEINLPAAFARPAWDLLRETGATRYGTEAMHALRAEKGFIVVGQETDGTATPDDLGLTWTIARGKPDFVGGRSLTRPDMSRSDRLQLVGLLTADRGIVLEEGAQVTEDTQRHGRSIGHVTSACHSVTLDRSIALALVAAGRSRIGAKLIVPLRDQLVEVTVTEPVFYDRSGHKMTPAVTMPDRQRSSRDVAAVPVRLPPVPACQDADMTLAPPAGKFSVRTEAPIAPVLRAAEHPSFAALWLGPDEFLVFAAEAPSIPAASIVDLSDRTVGIRIAGARAAWCLNAFCPLDLDDFPLGGCTRTLFGKAEIILWRLAAPAPSHGLPPAQAGDRRDNPDPQPAATGDPVRPDDSGGGATQASPPAGPVFHIEIARSLAPYVWACLQEARREFLPPAAPC